MRCSARFIDGGSSFSPGGRRWLRGICADRAHSVDTGFIGQNVYLFCASEGLASIFRAYVDYAKLERILELGTGQFVTFAKSVGYPSA
jgi:nitroreductase